MTSAINYVEALPKTSEIVIIGGGIVGAATAFFAARAGMQPLLVERRPALATFTTAASTGAYRLQFDNKQEWVLVKESVELFENFQDVTSQSVYDLGVRRQGYLWVTTDEKRAQRQRRLVELQHSWGQTDVEILDTAALRREFPYVTPEAVQARWRGGDGFIEPKELTLGLALGSGARVRTGCEVTRICVEGERVVGVDTAEGSVDTDVVVVATGPFSGPLVSTVGVDLPVTTLARHKVVMPDVGPVPAWAPMTIDDDTGAHWRPALAGAFLLYTDPETRPSPPADPVPPEPSLAFRLLDPSSPVAVARIAPFWSRVWDHGAAQWLIQSGHYTMTPDHRPLLGPTCIEGLYVNTGYSGHGIMGGPAGSRHFVDVLTGKVADRANPFRLERVYEQRELDVL